MKNLFENLENLHFYLIGIKGTGMTAIAQYLHRCGAHVTGSDTDEIFYTDEILKSEGITYFESFSDEHITPALDVFIYSAAYSKETNCELSSAVKSGKPVFVYPEALGHLSDHKFSIGVSGIHGKTTTTALIGTLIKELSMKGAVIVGSGVRNFNGSQILYNGDDFLIAETCEYRRHFLHFSPNIVLLTSIEPDHLDYFKDYNDVFNAFCEYVQRIPAEGILIYCNEDKGACELADWTRQHRKDLQCIPYGGHGDHIWSLSDEKIANSIIQFSVKKYPDTVFEISIPGHHSVLNAAGSLALIYNLMKEKYDLEPDISLLKSGLRKFSGTNRRSEILYSSEDYLIMDDYAHHPTAIKTTLQGIKTLYPDKRLIVSFMSHTYSRTNALFEEFANALLEADIAYLHKIYASAREQKQNDSVEGKDLFLRYKELGGKGYYYNEPHDSIQEIFQNLKTGDIFITLGAGNNWEISHEIAKKLENTTI